jgi:hypothetical protein
MPKKPIKITLRIYEDEEKRLARIAKIMSGPGNPASLTVAMRYVLERGYDKAERDLGIVTKKAKRLTDTEVCDLQKRGVIGA